MRRRKVPPQNTGDYRQTAAKESSAQNDQIRQLFPYILSTLCSKLPGDAFLNAHDLALLEGDGNKQIITATLNYIYVSSIKTSIITSEGHLQNRGFGSRTEHKGLFLS